MNRFTLSRAMTVAAVAVGLGLSSRAQEKDHHHEAPHGGLVVTVGKQYHFELVVKDRELNLYVLDAKEKVLPVKEVSGDIVVLMGKEKKSISLSPSGDFLKAEGDFAKAQKFTAVATVTIGGKNETGRFVYEKKKTVPHYDEKADPKHLDKDEHHEKDAYQTKK